MQIESGKRSGWERRKSKEVRGTVAPKSMQHLFVFTFWAQKNMSAILFAIFNVFCCVKVGLGEWLKRGGSVRGVGGRRGTSCDFCALRYVVAALRMFAVSFFYYCSQCVREFTLYIPMLRGRRFTFIIYTQAVVVPRVGAGAVRW